MNPTTTQVATQRPVGQGNPNWLGDIKSGNLAHTRQPAAKKDTPAVAPVLAQPVPTPVEEGITAPVAASPAPVETVPIPTPAAPASPEVNAGTVPTVNQPVSAAPVTQQPKTIVLDDPDAIIQIKNPDGTITEKSAKTMAWEEGMRAKVNRRDSELELREKAFAARVGIVEGDPFVKEYLRQRELGTPEIQARELASQHTGIQFTQPQQHIASPQAPANARPVAPEGKFDGDPDYEAYKAELIAFEVSKSLKPITDALQQTQASQAENQRQRQQAEENFRHNANLVNSVLPTMLPFDLAALEASDPVSYREALGRLKMAAQSEGIDLSNDGVKSINGKLDSNTMRIIALTAVNDGWNPTKKTAQAAPQSSIPIVDPVALELSRKLSEGEPLVPATDPLPPLVPVAPSGSPAGSSPNRMQQGNSSSSVPKWRQPLGLAVPPR